MLDESMAALMRDRAVNLAEYRIRVRTLGTSMRRGYECNQPDDLFSSQDY